MIVNMAMPDGTCRMGINDHHDVTWVSCLVPALSLNNELFYKQLIDMKVYRCVQGNSIVVKYNYPKYHLHRVTDRSTLVNTSTKIKLKTCLDSTKISGNVYV